MAEPIVAMEATSEYVRTTDLDALMSKIVSSLQPRIESIVEQAVQKAIEQTNTKTDEKIAMVKGELRGEFKTQFDQERQQRLQDNESLKGQLTETHQQLNEFKGVIDGAAKVMGEVRQSVELASTEIKGWNNTLTSTRQQYEDARRDIDRIGIEAASNSKAQAAQSEQLNTLQKAIHGGNGDIPSVFAELRAIRATQEAALEVARDVSNRQDQSDKERKLEKERHEKPRKLVTALSKKVVGIPYFWLAVVFGLMVIASIFSSPEAFSQLLEFARGFFEFLSAKP